MNTPIILYAALSALSAAQDNESSSHLIKILLLILGIAVVAFIIAFIKKKISSDQNNEDMDFFEDDNSYDNIHDNLSDVKLSHRIGTDRKARNSNDANNSHEHGQVLSSSGMRYDKSAEKRNKTQVSGGFGVGFSERDNVPEQSDDKTVELTVSHDGSWILPDDISDKKDGPKRIVRKNDDCYRNDSIFFGDDYF